MSSDKCLVCYNFQGGSKLFIVDENTVKVSNIFDPGETLSYSDGILQNEGLRLRSKLIEVQIMYEGCPRKSWFCL